MFASSYSLDRRQNKQVLIVTGLSGAGKTILMSALEDFGFYCVDNLPFPMLSHFLNLVFQSQTNLFKVSLGIDIRGQKFLGNFIKEIENIKKQVSRDMHFKIVFLNADENTLVRRFQTTRRNHPLSNEGSLFKAIKKEKEILDPVKQIADVVLDTDIFNVHELRRWVKKSFSEKLEQEILVNLISFGFKYGVPPESNLVYDLRFLPNPYFESELRLLDGRNTLIHDYLFNKKIVNDYWRKLRSFIKYSVQKFYQEGRFFVNISIGCTGGKHRSVSFVEKLNKEIYEHVRFFVNHRDLGKE